ncbi:unnamed protein product [Darwinula stevensoni]|uniref:Uncharacterized protein n=1 Tax=Darwinula stevensoni TaxID=69355 RepID=A0A7R8XJX0_9CRUS|nr:unnamed protein product [Darwinula stevensoni]CAG0892627.1 unnamed protein product [Darwinula stevensoni]
MSRPSVAFWCPVNTPTVNSPTVNSPTVNSPTVNSPTVNSPTVNSPTVNSPTVNSPTVNSPTGQFPDHASVREDAPVDDTVLFQVLCSSGCTELFILAASPNENEQFFKILQSNDTSADLGWAKPHAFEDFMGEDEIIIWLQGNLQSFVLLILPVNDKVPYWDDLPLQISVEEGFVGEVPGANNEYWIKALDDDFGDSGSLSYSLSVSHSHPIIDTQ